MTDLPTLEAALKLADQDSPLPSLAGPALKVLRDYAVALSRALPTPLNGVALAKLSHLRERGAREFAVAVTTDHDRMVACVSPLGRVTWFNGTRDRVNAPADDSATLTALIAELRAREAVGRTKYGTDVDRIDLTNAQWRQHLREELMDALLYSLAEERTCASGVSVLPEIEALKASAETLTLGPKYC